MEVNQKERAGLRIQLVMRPYIENIFMTSGRQRGSHMATGMMSSSSAGPGCQRRVQEGGADLFLASGWVHCGTHGRWSPVTADLQAAAVGSLRCLLPLPVCLHFVCLRRRIGVRAEQVQTKSWCVLWSEDY